MGSLETLAGGILGLIAAAGIGSGFIHSLGQIPGRWRIPIALISGLAIFDLFVMLALFLGGGVTGVKFVGAGAIIVGCCVLVSLRKYLSFVPLPTLPHRTDRWFVAVIVGAVAINLAIAVAPSTKIDELHYHMLIPKRVMEDHGLYLYRQPYEAAIFPQNAFQLGLTVAHSLGCPEAGNVISWSLGAALVLLVVGVTVDLTGSATAGWMTGAISAVGLYPAVWHVTSGPHALGDLATVVASLLALLPDGQMGEMKPTTRLTLVCLAAYTAASTKISLLPLAATITLIGVHRAAVRLGWKKATAIALSVWGIFYGPILLWTTLRCGSPFGLATATIFHSHYFGPGTIARMAESRAENQTGWVPLLTWLIPSVSVGFVAAFAIVTFAAVKRERPFGILFGLVCGQAVLIAWLLPHNFRFLGGLQYVVLIFGAWILWRSRFGACLMTWPWLVLLGLCIPWLGVQAYYAKPFIKVVSGIESRDSFLRQYVPFTEDFRDLNRILPANAVLYVVNSRLPAYYAPRPVVFTLEDYRGGGPLYRFTVGGDSLWEQGSLKCTETVYENTNAVSVVYRTPGRPPVHEPLKVERCDVVQSSHHHG
jgi:hypothetical protein